MFREERIRKMLELVNEREIVSYAEISLQLGVSEITIRRDAKVLASERKIEQVQGGVATVRNESYEPPYVVRIAENAEEKAIIGKHAAELIEDSETIFLDVGTTPLQVAKNIPSDKRITVVTSWLPIVFELVNKPRINIIIVGGNVNHRELSIGGGFAEDILKNLYVDKAFIGVAGISVHSGLTDYRLDEIYVKKLVIKNAKKVIALADHSKILRTAPIKIVDIDKIHQIITTDLTSEEHIKGFSDYHLEVTAVHMRYQK
jgi:DeoR family fructose operon transcriptional repressor